MNISSTYYSGLSRRDMSTALNRLIYKCNVKMQLEMTAMTAHGITKDEAAWKELEGKFEWW